MDDIQSVDITPRLTITIQAPDEEHHDKVTFVISLPASAEALTIPKLIEQIDGLAIESVLMTFADKETTLSLRRGPCEHGDRMDLDVFADIFIIIAEQYHVEPSLVIVASAEDDAEMTLARFLGNERPYARH